MDSSNFDSDNAQLRQFLGKKYLNIETYRKNGIAVRTPVWFVFNDKTILIRTSIKSGKYKRIKNNHSVKIAPCNFRGKVNGEWLDSKATPRHGDEAIYAFDKLSKKYGIMYKLLDLFMNKKDEVIIGISQSE